MNNNTVTLIGIVGVFGVLCLGFFFGYLLGEIREFRRMNKAFQWAVKKKEQHEGRVKELEDILWNCRHGGKGGVPVYYQSEVDRLLVTHQGEGVPDPRPEPLPSDDDVKSS